MSDENYSEICNRLRMVQGIQERANKTDSSLRFLRQIYIDDVAALLSELGQCFSDGEITNATS